MTATELQDLFTVRVEVGDQWAEIKDLRRLNFGEVRRLRGKAQTGDEDAVLAVAASCIINWVATDYKTGESLGAPSLETIDRVSPAFGLAICNAVAEGLSSALPLGLTKESPPS